jgi:hypothetical protein
VCGRGRRLRCTAEHGEGKNRNKGTELHRRRHASSSCSTPGKFRSQRSQFRPHLA